MPWMTANGIDVVEARVSLYRVGAWVADIRLDAPEALDGTVELTLGEGVLELMGTARLGGVVDDSGWARVVAGAGGWRSPMPARYYTGATVRMVLEDILEAAGETLESSSDADLLAKTLPFWSCRQGEAGQALATLLGRLDGVAWRHMPSGKVWFGRERWDPVEFGFETLDALPQRGRVVIATETPVILPGQSWQGLRVSYVEHCVGQAKLRTTVLFEETTP